MTGDERERKAIDRFISIFNGSYQKLSPTDIDYKVFDSDGKIIAYVEVCARYRNMSQAYPLPIDGNKLMKLFDKRLTPVIIWSCDDGIIYGRAEHLRGEILFDGEVKIFYDRQKAFKYIRYTDFS
jgi:hypothetical protein